MFGKEAALFVASGTMANAIALRTHTSPVTKLSATKPLISTSMKVGDMLHFVGHQYPLLKVRVA